MGVNKIKKSFSLLISILLVSIFSFLLIFIFQTKNIQSINIKNQYLYIQATNHKEFLKQYLKEINLENTNKFEIKDDIFNINAFIKKIDSKYEIDIFIKAKDYDIKIYERIIL